MSTDRILAAKAGIHLLSFSLKQGLEHESFWVFTDCVKQRRFSNIKGKAVEYHSIAMAKDESWQWRKERKMHGQENKYDGFNVWLSAHQAVPALSWEKVC